MQTTYAELLERCAAASFSDAFPEDGAFTCKTINGRRYWYFQTATSDGRSQRYAGPESPELLERIAHHKQARDGERERRALVSALVRSFGLVPPIKPVGDVLAALARAGIFRLRSILIGTVAYQCYSAMLSARLPNTLLQTNDIDIAQFTSVSIAIGDRTRPMLEVLQDVDATFHEIPHTAGHRFSTSYVASGDLRVDFVTPNEGPDTDSPQSLPALETGAQPLRFLDFLIHEPAQAVVLHGHGIYVQVPAPERFAVHKLILALDRPAGITKRDKDLAQAGSLITVLAQKRPEELKQAWHEAHARGPKWRKSLLGGLRWSAPGPRDILLKTIGLAREILPGIDLTFNSPPAHYDTSRDVVTFTGESLGNPVKCAISGEALEDHFGADGRDKNGRVDVLLRNRSKIERLARVKYLSWPVEAPDVVLLRTTDIDVLSALPS